MPGEKLPRARYFQIWNEPKLSIDIEPQWHRVSRRDWVSTSPAIYRGMLSAAYAAIKRVRRDKVVLAAGTAPYGDAPGGYRTPLVLFLRGLWCLRVAALKPVHYRDPAHLDALEQRPYSFSPTAHAHNPDNGTVADKGRLTR